MAWLTGWSNRVKITVDHTKVGGATLTDFPVYFNMANLPAGFWSGRTGYTDVKVVDSDGNNCPRDIGFFDVATTAGELYFKAASLSHLTDGIFYLYYGNAGATEANDTTTWSSYVAVYLFNETPSETPECLINHASLTLYHGKGNSGAGADNFGDGGTYDNFRDGKFGKAWWCKGTGTALNREWIEFGTDDALDFVGSDFSVSLWLNRLTSGFFPYIGKTDEFVGWLLADGATTNGDVTFLTGGAGDYSGSTLTMPALETWFFLAATHDDDGNNTVYVNDVVGTPVAARANDDTSGIRAGLNGRDAVTSWTSGSDTYYSQVRIAGDLKTAGWLLAEYNNTSSPATFYTAVDYPDDTAPVVADLALAPAGPYAPGDTVTITWTATDDVAVVDEQVLASYDGGGTWAELTSGVLGGTYEWTVPSEETAQARIKVVATDAEANAGEASTGDFTIATPVASGRTRQAMYIW